MKCRAGRACSIVGLPLHPRETCICNNPKNCHGASLGRKGDVCGSNRQIYSSHCELHSVACVTKTHIIVMRGLDHCLRAGSTRRQEEMIDDATWADEGGEEEDLNSRGISVQRYYLNVKHNAVGIISDLGNTTRSVHAKLFSPLRLHCLGGVNDSSPTTRKHQTNPTNSYKGADKRTDKNLLNVAGKASEAFTWTKDGNIVTRESDLLMLRREFIEFVQVTYHHVGIYTCLYASTASNKVIENMHVLSKFQLNVRSAPIVRIFPTTQFHTPGDTIQLQCHVISYPPPSISWHVNEEPLNLSLSKYQLSNENRTLEVHGSIHIVDTGAYKCMASNNYETSQDVATVFVEDTNVEGYQRDSIQEEELFLLTRSGVKVIDPTLCRLQPISFRLSTQLFLHHPFYHSRNKKSFYWKSAVIVQNRFVFASLKKSKYLFRLDTTAFTVKPIEKIHVGNCTPTNLRYLVDFDEVWGDCVTATHVTLKDDNYDDSDDDGDNGDDDDDDEEEDEVDTMLSSIVVIKNAAKENNHDVLFVDLDFQMVRRIFIPPINDLNFTWNFAFASTCNNNINNISNNVNKKNNNINNNINNKSNNKNNNSQLLVFNLTSKLMAANTQPIDLSIYRCRAENVHYVVFGGKVIIECSDATRRKDPKKFHYLQLDLTTQHLEILPLPQSLGYHLSPDSKLLTGISIDLTCLIVYRITPEGTLEEVTNTAVMDWLLRRAIFIASPTTGYDVAVECLSNQELLKYDVKEKRVDILNKKSKSNQELTKDKKRKKNHFLSGGFLQKYVLTSYGSDGLVLLDVWNNSERCSWKNLIVDFVLWVDPVQV